MTRQVTSENARINRRCSTLLDKLKAGGFTCSGDLPHRVQNACSHVRYGTRLDKHATKTLRTFTMACPSTLSGPKRRRKRR